MQHAHKYDISDFHGALLDIISVMNQPGRDDMILSEAGVQLEQILFPLLVTIERYGPIGVVDVADRLGRDYTTVSRQIKRLESHGLAEKKPNEKDKRVSSVTITANGQALTAKIAQARMKMMNQVFSSWQEQDVSDLFRLVRHYADSIKKV